MTASLKSKPTYITCYKQSMGKFSDDITDANDTWVVKSNKQIMGPLGKKELKLYIWSDIY